MWLEWVGWASPGIARRVGIPRYQGPAYPSLVPTATTGLVFQNAITRVFGTS